MLDIPIGGEQSHDFTLSLRYQKAVKRIAV
jgi:hypothetical protein